MKTTTTTTTKRRTYHLAAQLSSSTTPTGTTTTTEKNTSSTSTTKYYHGRNSNDTIMELETIKLRYHNCLGATMPKHLSDQVLGWLKGNTIPAEYFLYGLQEAAYAPRPSWRYVMAVVRRLASEKYPVEMLPVSWL